jgi:hypothetical protein
LAIGKVISGGQTGVDIAALRAARSAGIETGGWCPKGWRTELGPQPDLLKEFGLRELSSPKYPARTRANIETADCTIIVADMLDTGSELTARLCRQLGKPMLRLTRRQIVSEKPETVAAAVEWLTGNPHAIVNAAGNRESRAPGIESEAEPFLREVFEVMNAR